MMPGTIIQKARVKIISGSTPTRRARYAARPMPESTARSIIMP